MESSNGSASSDSKLHSSMPHVVVQCPSCTTKFAVESAAVAAIEKPRFHCSRCDAIFYFDVPLGSDLSSVEAHSPVSKAATKDVPTYNAERENRYTPPQVTTSKEVTPELEQVAAKQSETRSTPSQESEAQSTKTQSGTTQQSNTQQSKTQAKPFVSDRTQLPRSSQPRLAGASGAPIRQSDFSISASEPDTASETETPQQEAVARTEAPATGEALATNNSESTSAPKLSGGWTLKSNEPSTTTASSKDEVPAPKEIRVDRQSALAAFAAELTASQISSAKTAGRSAANTAEPRTSVTDSNGVHGHERATPGLSLRLPAFTGPTQGLFVLSMPLLAVLCGLFVLSYSLRLSPQSFSSAVTAIFPSFLGGSPLDIPPAGLAVKDVSLKFVRTETGEVVPVVHGNLLNSTEDDISGVTLEGLGFDARGEVVLSSQAPLRSALTREKFEELSLEQVKKFQVSLNARRSSIAVGEEVPFTVALLGDSGAGDDVSLRDIDLSQVKYFSARVFSVR